MAVGSQYHFSIEGCRADPFDKIIAEHSLSAVNEVL